MLDGPRAREIGTWDREADVVVVGMGAAGCTAAIAAHDAGARVLVVEKMPAGREGGNTRVSGGIWFDNRDPEGIATYLRSLSGDFPVPEDVVAVWAAETARNTAFVESLGATVARHGTYTPEYPELPGSEAYGGYLAVDGEMGNQRLFSVLARAVHERGIEVLLDAPAQELVQDPTTRAITGVVATVRGAPLRARARRGVVLATGGFEANPEMVRDYLRMPASVPWGTPAATGDGHKMAQRVGADLWHMGNMMAITGLRAPGWEAGFYIAFFHAQGFLYVGRDGTRFANELPQLGHGQARVHGRYELFPAQPMHVVFDERTRLAGPLCPGMDTYPVGWNLLVEGYRWSHDNAVEIEKGWIQRADTIAELAGRIGVAPAALAASVARYNAACASGVDDQFGRDPATLVPVSEPPFYAFTWGPMIAWSNGGPRRNGRAQVLDAFGEVIPRLYAAGNVSSTYSWCKDGGMHIADALAFGRVAGRAAAAEPPIA
jgi:succinate dehydrogenase/fumarate reductase flavoprotein subunit